MGKLGEVSKLTMEPSEIDTLREKPIHFQFYSLTSTVLQTSISGLTGFPLFCSSVCPIVRMDVWMRICLEATGHSFRAINLKFGTHHPCRLRKKS